MQTDFRWNWHPDNSKLVFIDLETVSECDLTLVGSRRYLADPSTRLLCLVAKHGETLIKWVPPSPIPDQLEQWARDGFTFVAHNAAGFDALAYRLLCKPKHEPEWCDTLPCARQAGYPAGLDALGEVLLGRGKDKVGQTAMKLLTRAKNGVYPVGTPQLWDALLRYNVQDVTDLETVYHATCDHGEPDVLEVHQAILDRGIGVDRDYVRELLRLWTVIGARAERRVHELTGGALHGGNLKSVPQVRRWLASIGIRLESLNRKYVEKVIDSPDEFLPDAESDMVDLARNVLKCRQIATRSGAAKLQKLLDLTGPDGRVRDMLVYHGAHTGRWSGRGFQPQNISKGVKGVNVPALVNGIRKVKRLTDDQLSTLTRPVFAAAPGHVFATIDYAAIEARGAAWCAGEPIQLEAFREGKDIYLDAGAQIFGRPITKADEAERFIAKTTVLGCQYGMSARAFRVYCDSNRIDLDAAGTDADACVRGYRERYPAIPQLWRELNSAVFDAVRHGERTDVGMCSVYRDGSFLRIELPSGRCLSYRNARIENIVPAYCAALGLPETPKPTVVFEHPRGYQGTLYGGLITENVVQAICRDILATALIAVERAGLRPVLHVHDEIVCEVPERDCGASLKQMAEIMVSVPRWATGFPIAVEGHCSPRYCKNPWPNYPKVKL